MNDEDEERNLRGPESELFARDRCTKFCSVSNSVGTDPLKAFPLRKLYTSCSRHPSSDGKDPDRELSASERVVSPDSKPR